jgi:Fic family protein
MIGGLMKELTENFMKNFVMESDLIENIFFNQTKLLHDYPFNKDVGHFGAIKYAMDLAQRKISLQESDIKEIHELIMKEQGIYVWIADKNTREYRVVDVEIKKHIEINKLGRTEEHNIIFPNFAQIPSRMKNFIRKVNQWQTSIGKHCKEQNIEIIGRLHYMFEKIHPFYYGNGRVGRIIALYMILFADLEPFIFTSADKEEEYFSSFQHQNKMASYFVKKYREEKERLKRKEETKIPHLKSPRQEGNI